MQHQQQLRSRPATMKLITFHKFRVCILVLSKTDLSCIKQNKTKKKQINYKYIYIFILAICAAAVNTRTN